jgi:hypothetical protein
MLHENNLSAWSVFSLADLEAGVSSLSLLEISRLVGACDPAEILLKARHLFHQMKELKGN